MSWRQNPQFELILGAESGHASSGTQCNLQVQISRPTTSTVKVSIGLYIVPRYQSAYPLKAASKNENEVCYCCEGLTSSNQPSSADTPIPVTALNYAIMSGQLFKVPFSENPSSTPRILLSTFDQLPAGHFGRCRVVPPSRS